MVTIMVSWSLGFALGVVLSKEDSNMGVNLAVYQTDEKFDVAKTGYRMYTVQRGDSIYSIAKKFHILEWQLRSANGFTKDVIIHPKDEIMIPIINWASKNYEGKASWYGPKFHGKKMANGEVYDQNEILVAHRTLPLGMKVRITNLENGRSLTTKILDRGPYTKKNGKYDREVDLSRGAAKFLGTIKQGIVPVRIEPLG